MQYRTIENDVYQRRGRSTIPKPITLTDKQISRYKARVIVGRETDCWLFQANSKEDYPRFQGYLAHRIAYFIYKGEVPEGLTIDHLCRTKWCQNPNHLEAVTFAENGKRAVTLK